MAGTHSRGEQNEAAAPYTRLETDPPFADVLGGNRDVSGGDHGLCVV
jgi:hypothetical protein